MSLRKEMLELVESLSLDEDISAISFAYDFSDPEILHICVEMVKPSNSGTASRLKRIIKGGQLTFNN